MKRATTWLLGVVIAASALGGCVVDPRYGHYQPHGGYDRHDDDDDFYGGDHRHDHGNELPTLVCASKDGRPNRCRTDFRIRRADIDKRYSGSPCEYGRSWGYDGNEVWVDRGCRARFVLTPEHWR